MDFSKPIEELIVLNFHEETHESLFDPVLFLEYYIEENDEDDDVLYDGEMPLTNYIGNEISIELE